MLLVFSIILKLCDPISASKHIHFQTTVVWKLSNNSIYPYYDRISTPIRNFAHADLSISLLVNASSTVVTISKPLNPLDSITMNLPFPDSEPQSLVQSENDQNALKLADILSKSLQKQIIVYQCGPFRLDPELISKIKDECKKQ
ncbi:Hypothetical_protein [Hexamita inflata]|uniref:Hypothetical_protein n=1 Tax=Hexamita inflata TaxID=28002 RepID=A0AA86QGJ5_9EUKA|nr:Hypothetical protein HINF_LOCUS43497 [Hexamita inflata]